MWIPVKRVTFKNDAAIQTLPGTPGGRSLQYTHIASKSVAIEYSPESQLIRLRGMHDSLAVHVATHVSNVRELELLEPEPKAEAKK